MLSAVSPPLPEKRTLQKSPLRTLKITWKLVGPLCQPTSLREVTKTKDNKHMYNSFSYYQTVHQTPLSLQFPLILPGRIPHITYLPTMQKNKKQSYISFYCSAINIFKI